MNNFIFKSANRLIKNDSITLEALLIDMTRIMNQIQTEQRHQRSDLKDCNLKLQKLLIDKHLQQQVDEYFEETPPQTDTDEQ